MYFDTLLAFKRFHISKSTSYYHRFPLLPIPREGNDMNVSRVLQMSRSDGFNDENYCDTQKRKDCQWLSFTRMYNHVTIPEQMLAVSPFFFSQNLTLQPLPSSPSEWLRTSNVWSKSLTCPHHLHTWSDKGLLEFFLPYIGMALSIKAINLFQL